MRLLLLVGAMVAPQLAAGASAGPSSEETSLRRALQATSGVVRLPRGRIEITAALELSPRAHDLKIVGDPAGSELHAADGFRGAAILVVRSAARVEFSRFGIDGNRGALERPVGLPPANTPFARFYQNNGIVAEDVAGLTISEVALRNVANFAIVVGRSSRVRITEVQVADSGSRFANGRNNTTGGILLEQGTTDFAVERCRIHNVRGNGIWTHSWQGSTRSSGGRIADNGFDTVARDAIQVGHADNVSVIGNSGRNIGYPVAEVDVEGGGFPVAIDTAGNVDHSVYADNRFETIDGKCIDLDGFHHGEVRGNVCHNAGPASRYPFGNFAIAMNNTDPEMQSEFIVIRNNSVDGALYGGILVIGSHHVIENNRLRNLNLAHCGDDRALCAYRRDTEPDFLRSGIYLAAGAERPDPARQNLIENNELSGYGIRQYCIVAAPGVQRDSNTLRANRCGSPGRAGQTSQGH